MTGAKTILWDLETTSLKSDFGFILAAGYKFLGEKKTHVLSIGDFNAKNFRAREKALVKAFAKILASADISVTHNGQRYDHPWMNAKMLEHHLGYLPPIPQVDTLQIARKHLKTVSRKRLETLSYYLGTYETKTPVEGRIWVDAAVGSKSALKYIVDHCRADVGVLEEVYLQLRPLFLGHPRVKGYGPCRGCGSVRLQRRGYDYSAAKGQMLKVACLDCGAWERRPFRDCAALSEGQKEPARRSTARITPGKKGSRAEKGSSSAAGGHRRAGRVAPRGRRVGRRRK